MTSLVTACKYLTILALWRAPTADATEFRNITLWFPLVGAAIGVVLAATNYALVLYIDSAILSVLITALLIVASGAMPMAGTKSTFDGLQQPASAATAHGGAVLGFAAIVIVTLLKVQALNIMDEKVAANVFVTPMLARWALVVLLYGYHDRCDPAMRFIAEQTCLWHLGTSTLFTLTLATYLLGREALWIALALSLLALVSRALLHRRHAILTLDNLGAVTDVGEALSFVLLAVV